MDTQTLENNVFLFVPNLIGYGRIALAILSFYFMHTNYICACVCYLLSVALDAVDGYAARLLNQGSRLGGMLDQLTDRCGTMGLLFTLGSFYPEFMFTFQMFAAVDIACHWVFLHSTVLLKKESHKLIDVTTHPIMKIYYSNKFILGLLCGANETFFAVLYLMHFTPGPFVGGYYLFRIVLCLCSPLAGLKIFVTLFHGYVGCMNIAQMDMEERSATKKD